MGKTTTVVLGDRGFWTLRDARGVWLAFLIDQLDARENRLGVQLREAIGQWRVAAGIGDLGVEIPELADEQIAVLAEAIDAARSAATAAGDVLPERMARWTTIDDLRVGGGHPVMGYDRVTVERVLEVADGFHALVLGELPVDPPTGSWFLGTGDGMDRVMDYHRGVLPDDRARFSRGPQID